jgi:hypothetical protein
VVKALQQRCDLNHEDIDLSGASAGSIACVMAACNVRVPGPPPRRSSRRAAAAALTGARTACAAQVDMDHAMGVAMRLAEEAEVFTRSGGLAGVWGA